MPIYHRANQVAKVVMLGIGGLAVLGFLIVAVQGYGDGQPAASRTDQQPGARPSTLIGGTVEIPARGMRLTGEGGCTGAAGFADIGPGTQLTVEDGGGEIVATGRLASGTVTEDGETCAFGYLLSGIPDRDFYVFGVSYRAGPTMSRAEVIASLGYVFLTLG